MIAEQLEEIAEEAEVELLDSAPCTIDDLKTDFILLEARAERMLSCLPCRPKKGKYRGRDCSIDDVALFPDGIHVSIVVRNKRTGERLWDHADARRYYRLEDLDIEERQADVAN